MCGDADSQLEAAGSEAIVLKNCSETSVLAVVTEKRVDRCQQAMCGRCLEQHLLRSRQERWCFLKVKRSRPKTADLFCPPRPVFFLNRAVTASMLSVYGLP